MLKICPRGRGIRVGGFPKERLPGEGIFMYVNYTWTKLLLSGAYSTNRRCSYPVLFSPCGTYLENSHPPLRCLAHDTLDTLARARIPHRRGVFSFAEMKIKDHDGLRTK